MCLPLERSNSMISAREPEALLYLSKHSESSLSFFFTAQYMLALLLISLPSMAFPIPRLQPVINAFFPVNILLIF